MSNVSDRFAMAVQNTVMNQTKQIKFVDRDQLKIEQKQIKIRETLDAVSFTFDDPSQALAINIDILHKMLESTDRSIIMHVRQKFYQLQDFVVYYNQCDDDLKDPEATKTLLFLLNQVYRYLFDHHVLKTRLLKDSLILEVRKGHLESSMLIDEIRSFAERPSDIALLESGLEKKKKKK